MFRPPLRVFAFLVVLLTLLGSLGTATAQEATPPAGTPEPATFRALAAGLIEILEPSTANVVLGRMSLQPGASIPFDETDPSALLVYMASGELTFRVDAAITVARAGGRSGTPTPPEAVAADTEFTLGEGDSVLFPGAMADEVRNAGTEATTAWVVDIVAVVEAAATPTP